MSNDSLDDFFNNLFGGEGGGDFTPPPPPTDEELCAEAMKVTDAHLVAYYAATESITRPDNLRDMLDLWLEELSFYLPMLEDFEEYEQCSKVFKAIREIQISQANEQLLESLSDLDISVIDESELTTDNGEPDF
jgi:hypothetical protein